VAAEWADLVEERVRRYAPPFDAGLVRRGVELLRTLPDGAARSVVVHGDANPGNVLAAVREPWLVIDPKPMVGDPAYDLCPLLLQVDDPLAAPDPDRVVRDRLALLADRTGVPAERIAAWCVARTVEAALWSVDRGRPADGADAVRRAAVLDRLVR
jgi:streptomycin 6-kinase